MKTLGTSMNKFVTLASDVRVSALVCSSIAILLAGCGGGDATDAGNASQTQAQPQVASYLSSNLDPAVQAEPSAAQETNSAPDSASAGGTVSPHEFDLVGYQSGPFAADDGSQPASALSAASLSIDGNVTPAAVVI